VRSILSKAELNLKENDIIQRQRALVLSTAKGYRLIGKPAESPSRMFPIDIGITPMGH